MRELKKEREKLLAKTNRVINLKKQIDFAIEHGDENRLTELYMLLILERIEDRLGEIAFLLKQGITDFNRRKGK